MGRGSLRRSIFQRLFGIPATKLPRDPGSWRYAGGELVVELARVPELGGAGGGVRFEGRGLPRRVLVVRAEDGSYRAFHNRCRHFGRRLDPLPGGACIQCSSVSKATYDLSGTVVSGPARGPLETYPVEVREGKLVVRLGGTAPQRSSRQGG
ncbi:MAG: Rieske (2Fe-2S) protein [Planctomycetota bacterium]